MNRARPCLRISTVLIIHILNGQDQTCIEIIDGIFLGDDLVAENVDLLKKKEIKLIISLEKSERKYNEVGLY